MARLMQGDPLFDHAVVDTLQQTLDGAADVLVVGPLADTARARLARALAGELSIAETPGLSRPSHDTVVVLDTNRLEEGETAVRPRGTLVVAAANPRYAPFLLEVLEGSRRPWADPAGLDAVCRRLEADGWEVEEARPVIVPLALVPFDPVRVPKTVLAYLYAREPEIEAYCFLVRARQPLARPPSTWVSAPAMRAEFPTTPWKSEVEWREEAERLTVEPAESLARRTLELSGIKSTLEETRRQVETLHLALRQRDDELGQIKSSPVWRAVVKYRTARERALPPGTGRGRAYERVRLAVHRLVDRGG
jgi:hypothetical protein